MKSFKNYKAILLVLCSLIQTENTFALVCPQTVTVDMSISFSNTPDSLQNLEIADRSSRPKMGIYNFSYVVIATKYSHQVLCTYSLDSEDSIIFNAAGVFSPIGSGWSTTTGPDFCEQPSSSNCKFNRDA